jgi:hypothetical protein
VETGKKKKDKRRNIRCTRTSNVEDEFGFPILDPTIVVQMKNIPPSSLPNFHGMVTEDPRNFSF